MDSLILFILMVSITISGATIRFGQGRDGLGAPAGAENIPIPRAKYFAQKLDHNNPSDLSTWKQRYFVDSKHFRTNAGPVFLMIGGEGPADARWMVKGAWIEYAEEFKALCFQLEHRFYGESHPTRDTSVKSLQYLTSMQALEDIATFIAAMNVEYRLGSGVQWVVFGGSYPGSLAAWARLKYPHLVFAAVSSSGPLLAKVNFQEYFKGVVAAIREKTGNDNCIEAIKYAFQEILFFLNFEPKRIEKAFGVCSPFEKASLLDINNFFSSLADNLADLVQYNEDNRFTADINFKNVTINSVCDILTRGRLTEAFENLAEFNSIMLKKSHVTCLDYNYASLLKQLKNSEWGSDSGRQWLWQTCTEFGFYQTSTDVGDIFGNYFPLEFFTKQCQEVFGSKYGESFINASVQWTNNKYGALDIKASRIIFVHGSVDPWHLLGITSTKNKDSPAIFIKGTAHCANMYPSAPEDLPQLTAARDQIKKHLKTWLSLP